MKRPFLIIILLWVHCSLANAESNQRLTLQLFKSDGAPLVGVKVNLADGRADCTTDVRGQCFYVTDLPHLYFELNEFGYQPVQRLGWPDDKGLIRHVVFTLKEAENQAKEKRDRDEAALREEEARVIWREKAKTLRHEADIKSYSDLIICFGKGFIVRSESLSGSVYFLDGDAEMINNEFIKRRLRVDIKLVREQKFKIGSNECTMAAAYGVPNQSNRSVGSWGVRVQHIYRDSGTYVYTHNGVVQSWQD